MTRRSMFHLRGQIGLGSMTKEEVVKVKISKVLYRSILKTQLADDSTFLGLAKSLADYRTRRLKAMRSLWAKKCSEEWKKNSWIQLIVPDPQSTITVTELGVRSSIIIAAIVMNPSRWVKNPGTPPKPFCMRRNGATADVSTHRFWLQSLGYRHRMVPSL